jgi:exo-beta-1,3-glucanase (GH17 family)
MHRVFPYHGSRVGFSALLLRVAIAALMVLTAQAAALTLTPAAPGAENHRWYFAEGYTGTGFHEFICIGNPEEFEADIDITFLFNGSRPLELSYEIAPRSRQTVDVNRVVGPDREVSVVVTSGIESLAVERSIYFMYQGRDPGSHIVQGARSASRVWYFAEGYTGAGFEEYLCILNPNDLAAGLTFRFQTGSGERVKGGLSVPAGSRATFKVNDLVGPGQDVSVKVESDRPVVAERPMYFDYMGTGSYHWEGGHCVMGADSLDRGYFFAEGTTRPGFEQWLTLQNPGSSEITVDASYKFGEGQGPVVERSYLVGGKSRRTVFVPDEVGCGRDVSVRLECESPFLAERPLYYSFSRPGLFFEGGHCALGVPQADRSWFLAEGYTGPYFEQWLCVQNHADTDSDIRVEYFTQEGGALPAKDLRVPAGTRVTLLVNEHAGPDLQVSTRLTVVDGPDVIVERPIYFDRFSGMPPCGNSDVLYGLCFSPYLTEDPFDGAGVSVTRVATLLDRIAPFTRWIRTFCSQGEWDAMPGLAIERGLRVAAGCDIYTDLARNQKEVDSLIAQVERGEVDLAVVGDEVLFTDALSEDQLIGYIRQVKASGAITATSDTWREWITHPRLAAECDVIILNLYPYWEGVAVEDAVESLEYCYEQVKGVADDKKVIVETGWPAGGATVGAAVPNPRNAARYLDEFMEWAHRRGVEYFYFEAFDEQWKEYREGECGRHWGLWSDSARLKPEIEAVIRSWR